MIVLTIRTDKPEAEIGLYEDAKPVGYETWQAHRRLAETIHQKIIALTNLKDIQGIVVFQGPGSFTGLRIGLSVANALAYSLQIPLVATLGDDWIQTGIGRLQSGQSDIIALPEYGAPAHTTIPGK